MDRLRFASVSAVLSSGRSAIEKRQSLVAVLLLACALLNACSREGKHPSSNDGSPPKLLVPVGRVLPPVPFRPDKIDEFLAWVAAAPASERETVRRQIAAASESDRVVDRLTERLMRFPVTDRTRHLVILSTLGEMRPPRAINALKQFIWYDREMFALAGGSAGGGNQTSFFNPTRALQSRAVEMLAYIGGNEALAATLEVAARHTGPEVRIAAMNAYLFNQGDSETAKAELARVVRESDLKYIGLARFTRDMNVKQFNAQVRAYYEKFPSERPIAPVELKKSNRRVQGVGPEERKSD